MDDPQLSAQPGRLASAVRRPIVRIVLVILVVLILWSVLGRQKPGATVAIVNATGEPLHNVTLVLENGRGAQHVEQAPALGPGGRWEHESPEGLLRVVSLQVERGGKSVTYRDLGEIDAGRTVTITLDEKGMLYWDPLGPPN